MSRPRMVLVDRANPTDRADVERLIAAYHASEGAKPKPERISWAVDQVLRNRFPGVVLIGREKKAVVGVALAIYSPSAELGRVLVVNDFFVDPAARRKGVGRALAQKLLEEAKAMRVDRIDLEILPTNTVAAAFWKALGFRTQGRMIYSRDLL
jgi:GNAT superfamily N-acetyltransferase